MNTSSTFELVRRAPGPRLAPLVSGITGYVELQRGCYRQCEAAALTVPLIIGLGSPFRIALGRKPDCGDAQRSFAAGLYPGPVHIESDGAAECVQIDFTPLGAYCFFGGAAAELTARMVDVDDVLGHVGRQLRQRLGETACWRERFAIIETAIAERVLHQPSREITFAYGALAGAGGDTRIADLAAEIGWSRKHFINRFTAEIGLRPKTIARMMRFERACTLARTAPDTGWTAIAFEAGYADQAHMVREFGAFAGESPTAWARRVTNFQAGAIPS